MATESYRGKLTPMHYRLLGAGMLFCAALFSSRDHSIGFIASKRLVSDFGASAYLAAGNIDETRRLYPHYIPNLLDTPHFLSITPRLDIIPIQLGVEVDVVSFETVGVLTLGDHPGLQEEARPLTS